MTLLSLSTAMRLGSLLHPQQFRSRWDAAHERTCALQAAADGAGVEYFRMLKAFPVLGIHAVCPACACEAQLNYIITHLNDHHEWTRERIADFVQTFEEPTKTATPAEPVAELACV
jgi:hypothetical protein